jgi:hypothetical protein
MPVAEEGRNEKAGVAWTGGDLEDVLAFSWLELVDEPLMNWSRRRE